MNVVASIVGFASTVPTPPVGFFQVSTALVDVVASTVATRVVGASGAVPTAMGLDTSEFGLLPRAFTASTRKIYVIPAVNDETVALIAVEADRATVVQVFPLSDEYEMM